MLEAIKQWAGALVLTAIAGSLACAVTDSGDVKKYIKFACALAALAVMIAPIKGLFVDVKEIMDLPNILSYNQETENNNQEISEELNNLTKNIFDNLLKTKISDLVYNKTGIKPEKIYIYSNIKENEENENKQMQMEIEKAEIFMNNKNDDENYTELKEYLMQNLNCEIVINKKE